MPAPEIDDYHARARKPYRCSNCPELIEPGEEYRRVAFRPRTDFFTGNRWSVVRLHQWCEGSSWRGWVVLR